ncbi:Fe3+-hydroxamate ABC transporter substrate-binding protein [Haloferax elongans ATCC BAA-1513]|uniref:Fe3+-hydroxamate ABC transporter substrate-binding protein n=1 Tax=Haloferax elongans ATCC BAA-1513 TaxID=1230453 RepID=M0HM58_HALEO|nr:ABC transporter substrate-binding protein [Haloferax elongans]ELZ84792.1 Fe3+-hydroxamate ABC transporter substrate-binding protein [Haloferax elongans ATCC BAA-1513]
MRVVSLVPSATELLTAIGTDPIGISHSCDYPPRVTSQPTLTSTAIDHEDRSSREIDEQMSSIDGAAYDLDANRLDDLDPDLVVTQSTCDVCAVDSSDVFEAVRDRNLDAEILALDPHSLDDVLTALLQIGEAVGKTMDAATLRFEIHERINAVESRVVGLDSPRTAVLDWTDPLYRSGHWVRDLVELAGGDGSFQPNGRSEQIQWDALVEYDPERLVVAPCGFSRERAVDAVSTLAERDEWTELTAVKEGHVYAVDGNALFNRPGPRLVDSLEVLASCIHPELSTVVDDELASRVENVAQQSGDKNAVQQP